MTNFKISVTSDTICPWCFVGRKQLLAAKELYAEKHPNSGDVFTVDYLPYMLLPDWPRGPGGARDKHEAYVARFGAPLVKQMHQRLRNIGRELNIDFKFGRRTGNTHDSQRLVRLAKSYGSDVEGKIIDELFSSYFEKEGDITDLENFRGIAAKAGIPDARFQQAIVDSDEGGKEVDYEMAQEQRRGIMGVPKIVLQDKYHFDGSLDPETFVSVLEKVKAAE
ncbi:Uu.00g056270.m01.CDS01 [Anthostomella pinea]|uniref:Uu.00g056270.m01.CDS01 n=1 Tax=Anthostomella pinea TaxID=933095 RepID=A0AAI8VRG8_9PEZI|nr:Uu.00g056270.m01.CDS01 [Anthostomella pinea]